MAGERKLIVQIVGDDKSLQQALARSSAATTKFSATVNSTLGKSGVSVSENFAPLLNRTRQMQSEAEGLSTRLNNLDSSLSSTGQTATGAGAGIAGLIAKGALAGIAIQGLYTASQQLQQSLTVTGREAFTTSGKVRNFTAALMDVNVIGAIQSLTALPKTLDDAGISAADAINHFEAFQRVAQGVGDVNDQTKESLQGFADAADEAGTSSQTLAQQAVQLAEKTLAAQNAADALADSLSRLGTVFITSTGQAVEFKGAVDDLGGLRGPGLVNQINANLQQAAGGFGKQISPGAQRTAAETIAQAKGDLPALLKLQQADLANARKALVTSNAVGKEREALNQALANARAAVITTRRQIEANAEADRKAAEAERKADAANARAAAARARAAAARARAAAARLKAAREEAARRAQELRAARLLAVQQRQFRQLGLAPGGEALTPTISNLQRQLGTLTERIVGTTVDTPKVRSQLARIGKVLSGSFGKATEETRKSIQAMFQAIRDEFDKGAQGQLTKTTSLNANKIISGLGLDPQTAKQLRARLSGFNSAGVGLAPGNVTTAFGRIVPPGGETVIHITTTLDGAVVASNTTRHQQKKARRNPKQKRGVR